MALSTNDHFPLSRIAIDRGGTFTDVVAERADGSIETIKLLSVDPGRYDDAAVEAVRRLTGVRDGDLPPIDVRIGTTVATNALLEHRGEPTLLAITRGFGDALAIGYQERPDIFARDIRKNPPLPARVVEIDERVDVDGRTVRALDLVAAEAALRSAHDDGLRSIATVLMHSWRYPAHEQALAELAARIGFTQISVSHRVSPLIRLVARGDTTTADAYLSPVLRRYVDGLEAAFGGERVPLFMQSSGGLAEARGVSGKDALLSGPAGGIVGMAAAAKAAGVDRVIGFDMGGTSTDVSLWAGRFERRQEAVIGGVRVSAPMLRIDTVAAGGGSICRFDGGRFVVGPESAGADPGPACYRRGGPLTVTDCNLLLGKIVPGHFPAVFGPDRDQPLDRDAAVARLDALLDTVEAATGTRPDPLAAAEGLVAIAVANMAGAIKAVSVARGHDPASYALMSFGGAGGQHACLVADALGMTEVLVHPMAGVLSAWGIALADRRAVRQRTIGLPLDDADWRAALGDLADEARRELDADAVIEATATLRYARTDQGIDVRVEDGAAMAAAFAAAHRDRFGFESDDALIVERLQVEAVLATAPLAQIPVAATASTAERIEVAMDGTLHQAPLHRRDALGAGSCVGGPALIVDATSTVAVEPDWSAVVLGDGTLRLTRSAPRLVDAGNDTEVDPIRLAIFAGLFMGLAEEMGSALQRSAASVNIRERLDFSCAIFDAGGHLIANAPHIPVHLGSMGDCVRHLIASRSTDGRGMRPGDAYAVNDPYRGGTHLPDITVVQPVFASRDTPAFFVAARGHHADVGGTSPGSMPADSRTIHDEGVVFDDVLVLAEGRLRDAELRALFGGGAYPARNIDQNIADLAAQLAACARGVAGLERLAGEQGLAVVSAYMEHVQAHAEMLARRVIRDLGDGDFAYPTDDGAVVRVAVWVDAPTGALTVDFTGTSDQRPGNTNAPLAVTRAAVLYVLRTLVTSDTPLNDGFLRPVTLIVPEGSMLNPRFPAAVVAGNVETSQVITDALMGALGAMAASQGTMNNFTFGDDSRQYYETIAGGAGAGPGFAGASAVQTHMTNSRLTDPEVLETRFPVLLEEFSIRRGSGGGGAWPGGDGATRRVRFREPMRANILSNHRQVAPFGLSGGGDGTVGANRIERADGRIETLASVASADMAPGDVFVIETPGGGGYGGVR
ncbi:hydantoinase B/oxoprolinase family protein [Sphingomonas sp. KR1UV-12]|uniref:Hydantoinase B/oxoprolinase family protein n=1 Tax=Sphingomonas aurea TaxID=3063994 RepID=A0ABT9EKV3_9SPHN|nr:hydantoinase B/oxoprolinase family protein [Sphingomonas sp. KR1UV-12]MDP1027597.1 hydantoinase B/oxoprolinase family protein [Sphingomonas sp. KR1UV-12]